jgi:hypothetical protein
MDYHFDRLLINIVKHPLIADFFGWWQIKMKKASQNDRLCFNWE